MKIIIPQCTHFVSILQGFAQNVEYKLDFIVYLLSFRYMLYMKPFRSHSSPTHVI